jgi:hypothetical protein
MPAFRREGLDLRTPHQADLRPTMNKDNQGSVNWTGLKEARCVAERTEGPDG